MLQYDYVSGRSSTVRTLLQYSCGGDGDRRTVRRSSQKSPWSEASSTATGAVRRSSMSFGSVRWRRRVVDCGYCLTSDGDHRRRAAASAIGGQRLTTGRSAATRRRRSDEAGTAWGIGMDSRMHPSDDRWWATAYSAMCQVASHRHSVLTDSTMKHRDCWGRCRRHQQQRLGITVTYCTVNGSNDQRHRTGTSCLVSRVISETNRIGTVHSVLERQRHQNATMTKRGGFAPGRRKRRRRRGDEEWQVKGEQECRRGSLTSKTVRRRHQIIRNVQLSVWTPAASKLTSAVSEHWNQTQGGAMPNLEKNPLYITCKCGLQHLIRHTPRIMVGKNCE